jgi:pimeloyl-ACP methyl ester carboxylesterase
MKLIFIHASGGTKESWYYQTAYFKDSEAIDLPGHGEGKPCTSINDYVQWLRGYIYGRGYKDVVLAGHSLGGGIAQLYALQYPEELKALILIGTGARLRVLPNVLEALEAALDDPQAWAKNIRVDYPFFTPEQREALRQKRATMGPKIVLNDQLCCDRFDIIDRVHEIELPTLLICGTEDVQTPVRYTEYLTNKIAGAKQVIIAGATHGVATEKPDEVNHAIEEFLNSL